MTAQNTVNAYTSASEVSLQQQRYSFATCRTRGCCLCTMGGPRRYRRPGALGEPRWADSLRDVRGWRVGQPGRWGALFHRAVLAAAVIRPSSAVRAARRDRGDQALTARDPGCGQRSAGRPASDPSPLLVRTDEQCGQHRCIKDTSGCITIRMCALDSGSGLRAPRRPLCYRRCCHEALLLKIIV